MARSSKKKGAATATAGTLRITGRIVDVKRHTLGYVIGNKTYSVAQTRRMAAGGRINGVRVVGNHIQAAVGRRALSALPVRRIAR